MIKVAVAEDNASLARVIAENIELNDGLELLFIAANGVDLLEQVQTKLPDIILMDISMPQMGGIEATRRIRSIFPQIRIIMLTVFDDNENVFQSILAGATGYVLKDEKPSKLFAAIEEAMDGGAPMSPIIAQKALRFIRGERPAETTTSDNTSLLSKRELEILELLSTGLDYQKIAERIFISPKTVRKHIENIYGKLQAHNKIEAISIAKNKGFI